MSENSLDSAYSVLYFFRMWCLNSRRPIDQLEFLLFFVFLLPLRNLAVVFAMYLEHWFGS